MSHTQLSMLLCLVGRCCLVMHIEKHGQPVLTSPSTVNPLNGSWKIMMMTLMMMMINTVNEIDELRQYSSNSSSEPPAKFQYNWYVLKHNLGFLRCGDMTKYCLVNRDLESSNYGNAYHLINWLVRLWT